MTTYRILGRDELTETGDEYQIPLVPGWWGMLPGDVGKTISQINSQTPLIPNRVSFIRRKEKAAMKVVYVAGPFRGPSAWDIECNIRRAETLALEVWRLGAAALCPHTNTRFFQNAAPDEVWLKGDLELLKRCDAMILTENWSKSSGARAEKEYAESLAVPIFYTIERLKSWLETHP